VKSARTAVGDDPFETVTIRNLAGLMKIAKSQKFSGFSTIFRGQSGDYPLVPAVGRGKYADRESVEVKPGRMSTEWYVDPQETGMLWAERTMLEQFERMAPSFVAAQLPSDQWEILAIAQHHGLPTRLLDWSYNPYVAAWFAVGRPPHPERKYGVLWIHVPDANDHVRGKERDVSPLKIRRGSSNRPLVFIPRFITPRIRAQDGLFTVHPFNAAEGQFLPMEKHGRHRKCMTKVIIPSSAFAGMADELNYVGVNAASLFPDLDGLSRKIMNDFASW
jgi:hypothetical protein